MTKVKFYTFRSDLMQLKISDGVRDTIKKIDQIIAPKSYILESIDIPNNTFNLNSPQLQVYTCQDISTWGRHFALYENAIDGITYVQVKHEQDMLDHARRRMEFMPYIYYYNGMFAANDKYFQLCYKA